MKICVTGGAGFIGSYLCEALLRRGHEVLLVDSLNGSLYPAESKMENLQCVIQIAPPGKLKLAIGDILNMRLAERLHKETCEVIFHLAAIPGVRYSVEHPVSCMRNNVAASACVLEAANRAGCRRVILASSSTVYGLMAKSPFSEKAQQGCPTSPYAASKMAMEAVAGSFHAIYQGLEINILRLFTSYGPRQRPDLGMWNFIEAAIKGTPVKLYGDGSQTRDFCFIEDTVRAFLIAMESKAEWLVMNVGTGKPLSVSGLLAAIGSRLGVQMEIDHLPRNPADMAGTLADTSHALDNGFTAVVPFEEGLERTIAWHRQRKP